MSDASIAAIARNLAVAVADAAYTRKDEDKKRISVLHAELCAEVRAETAGQSVAPTEKQT